jgi:predicted alpha/beta hydrolase family esterase
MSGTDRLLFLHGAGGYDEDRLVADALGASLGLPVDFPRLPDEDMSYDAWAGAVSTSLSIVGPGDVVVAHSFGASILLRVLSEDSPAGLRRATLLAMPDWTPDGWDVAEYAFTGPAPSVPLSLHHCRDDDVVPFDHLALHVARLPSAEVHRHDTGGHQFEGRIDAVAAELRSW